MRSILCSLLLATALMGAARAQTIDSLPEGTSATTLSLTGVALRDLDQDLGTAPDSFFVDDATTGLLRYDVGSPPSNNVVSFGGFLPGGDNLYGRCRSFRMTFSQPLPAVYFTMWISRADAGNSIQFDYKLAGQSQFVDTIPIPSGTAPFCLRMNPGALDEIVVTGVGPHDNGVFHAVLDGFLLGVIVDFAPTCDGGYNSGHTACPCGNDSTPFDSEGCAHSFGYGARLRMSGNASLSNDTLQIVCMQLPPNAPALFFQGTQTLANWSGITFGDGLRCAGGTIVRLAVKTPASDTVTYPEAGDAPISVKGMVSVNAIRTYQVWYRNAGLFCSSLPFNLSNGFAIGWSP